MKATPSKTAIATSFAALGAGAALMFFFDPDRGKKRRHFVRDKTASLARDATRSLAQAARDLRHRTEGVVAETRSILSQEPLPDDVVLIERIRSKLGRIISHPGAIDVLASDGEVILRGDVLQSEVHNLVPRLRLIPGVLAVHNELTLHDKPDSVSTLQGNGHVNGNAQLAKKWTTPGAHLLSGAVGCTLAFYGARKRGPVAKLCELAGLGLVGNELARIFFGHPARPSNKNSALHLMPAASKEQDRFELVAERKEWK